MAEEQSYEELYAKGFEEGNTEVEAVEETEEASEAEEEEVQEETEEQPTEEEESEQEEEEVDEPEESDTTEEEESDSNEEEPKYVITIGGQEVQLTLDEMKLFAQKGGDYTRKTQDLAKSRADIEFMKENSLSHEDLVMMKDIKDGNKDAFAQIAKQAGIDPLDVDDNSDYKPEVNVRNFELEDVVSDIRNDATNGSVIDGWISALPQSAKDYMSENPNVLKGLHVDTVSGLSKDIMPEVIKQMAINPNADFVQTYQTVGQAVVSAGNKEEAKEEPKPEAKRETKKRASVSKSKPTHLKDHQDVWDDDDLYNKMKKQLEAMK